MQTIVVKRLENGYAAIIEGERKQSQSMWAMVAGYGESREEPKTFVFTNLADLVEFLGRSFSEPTHRIELADVTTLFPETAPEPKPLPKQGHVGFVFNEDRLDAARYWQGWDKGDSQ